MICLPLSTWLSDDNKFNAWNFRIQDNQLGEQGPINSANESTEKQTVS